MSIRQFAFVLIPISCLSISCGGKVIHHQQHKAAKSAEEFADVAFVKADYAGARALLSRQKDGAAAGDELEGMVNLMHLKARPSEVKAIEYEPLSGRRAMNIYLKGKQGHKEFFYRFLMVGDRDAGYTVGGFWRRSGPYPPSARKPL